MSLTLLLTAAASATTVSREFCFQFNKDYDDSAAGDWWTDDSKNAKARGILAYVDHDSGTSYKQVDDGTGCATFNVDISSPDFHVTVNAVSEAQVSGVDVESYEPDLSF